MALLELLLLAAIWGGSFLFLRLCAPVLGALPLIELRVGIAALALLPVLHSARRREQLRRHWRPLAIVGLSNSALPFSLFAAGAVHLGAGYESILNATTPLWAALLGALAFGAAVSRAQVLGLAIGLGGVVLLVAGQADTGPAGSLFAAGFVLLAPVSYGFAAQYARRHLGQVDPVLTAFASQGFAALMLALPAAALWPAAAVPPVIWAYVLALALLCTAVAYALYFRLLVQVGAAYAASVTFLIPVFGMLWGRLFLHEAITPAMLLGCATILAGTALAGGQWQRLLRRRLA